MGVIHADLFPDNVFFQGTELTGIIDFYFACVDIIAYDLAICLNAWCFEPDGAFNITKARQMLAAYRAERPFTGRELEALPLLARGAALRFLLTRLFDWQNRVEGALVKPKDPLEYLDKLRFHRGAVRAPAPTVWTESWRPRRERSDDVVEIHTDGACSGNPGPGGWGAVLRWRGRRRELSGFAPATTNNRMELRGGDQRARDAQAADDGRSCTPTATICARASRPGCRPGRRAAGGPPTRSRSRTRTCGSGSSARSAAHRVDWRWVKGHSGNPDNERADQLAREAIRAGRAGAAGEPPA